MRSKILFQEWDKESKQFISREEFIALVNDWSIEVIQEFKNPDIKLVKENWNVIQMDLLDDHERTITVKKLDDDSMKWYGKRYQVHSELGWFPSDCVSVWSKIGFFVCGEPRYRHLYAGDIDWSENVGSMNMYTNDVNWERRKMLEDNNFKVIEQ